MSPGTRGSSWDRPAPDSVAAPRELPSGQGGHRTAGQAVWSAKKTTCKDKSWHKCECGNAVNSWEKIKSACPYGSPAWRTEANSVSFQTIAGCQVCTPLASYTLKYSS